MPDTNAFDACPSFEMAILDYLDGTLNEPDRRRVEMHMASCPACEAFWRDQKKLDSILSASLHPPTLPLEFKARMVEFARTESGRSQSMASPPTLHIENEGEDVLAVLHRTFLRGAAFSFLDGLGVLTVAACAMMLGYEVLTRSALLSGFSSQQITSYGAMAVGLAALVSGVWVAFRKKIRTLLEEP